MNERFQDYWRARLQFLDVHYHVSPDAFARRHGVVAAGRLYQALGGGVVLKNHLGDSVASAETARELGLPVFGSLVLNSVAGGPCWRTVEASLCKAQAEQSGRLLVHLPTFTGATHKSRLSRSYGNHAAAVFAAAPIQVSDSTGELRPEVIELLHVARDFPVVISTGHASRSETLRLIDAVDRYGAPRLMLNQPANPMTGLTADDLCAIAGPHWLYVEQTALTYLLGYQDWNDFAAVMADVPNVIYSSDLGQIDQPDISEWHARSQIWFDEIGLDAIRRASISLETPLAMLAP